MVSKLNGERDRRADLVEEIGKGEVTRLRWADVRGSTRLG